MYFIKMKQRKQTMARIWRNIVRFDIETTGIEAT